MVETVTKTFLRLPLLLLAFLAFTSAAFAHRLDEYLQATLVTIEPGVVRLEINLSPGVAVAGQVLTLIDSNHDGVISTNESAAYAELVKRDLVARLDQRDVELKLTALNFEEPAELRAGWGIIQIEYSATPGALAAGPHKFTLENRHHPVASAYLFNAARPGSALIQITGQMRNENQSTGEITFDYHPSANPFIIAGIVVSLAAIFAVLFVGVRRAGKKQKLDLQRKSVPGGGKSQPHTNSRITS